MDPTGNQGLNSMGLPTTSVTDAPEAQSSFQAFRVVRNPRHKGAMA